MRRFLNCLILFVGLLRCTDDPDPALSVDDSPAFYPLQTGDFHIYQVCEIVYTMDQVDTLNYQLKTEIVDSLPDGDNFIFVMHRLTRSNETKPWRMLDTWSIRKTDRKLVVAEGNAAYVKLAFPAEIDESWNGNEFNTLEVDRYQITNIRPHLILGKLALGEILTVTQEKNDDRFIFYDMREENYSRNIGLVTRRVRQIHYCTPNPCYGQEIIISGKDYTEQIIGYGRM